MFTDWGTDSPPLMQISPSLRRPDPCVVCSDGAVIVARRRVSWKTDVARLKSTELEEPNVDPMFAAELDYDIIKLPARVEDPQYARRSSGGKRAPPSPPKP